MCTYVGTTTTLYIKIQLINHGLENVIRVISVRYQDQALCSWKTGFVVISRYPVSGAPVSRLINKLATLPLIN